MSAHARHTSGLAGRARRLLRPGSLGRSISVLASGMALGQIIVALSSPLLSRLYAPADFGAFAVGTSLISILMLVGALGYERAIPLPREQEQAANLVVLSLVVALLTTGMVGLVLVVAGGVILRGLGAGAIAPYAWILLVGQLGGAVYLVFVSWSIRHRDFGSIARTRVTQSVTMVAAQIGLGIAGAGAPGLLGGDAVGRAAGSGRLARRAGRQSRGAIRRASWRGVRDVGRRYRRFPLLSSWAVLINEIGLQAPLLLVVALYGDHDGGLLAFGQRLIGAPLVLLISTIAQVFVAEAAILARDDPAALRGFFLETLVRMARVGVPVVVVVALCAPWLVGPVFGAPWREAGVYLAILSPLYLMQLLTSPFGGILDVLERQDLHLIREIVRVALVCGAIVVARELGKSATAAVVSFSVAGVLAYAMYGWISWHALTQVSRRRAYARAGRAAP